jgi:hypothetical protein
MRRPVNWLVFALALTFLLVGRSPHAPSPVEWIPRTTIEPAFAVAVPVALRRETTLEFGYVSLDSLPAP